jgi:hypothetical protein
MDESNIDQSNAHSNNESRFIDPDCYNDDREEVNKLFVNN